MCFLLLFPCSSSSPAPPLLILFLSSSSLLLLSSSCSSPPLPLLLLSSSCSSPPLPLLLLSSSCSSPPPDSGVDCLSQRRLALSRLFSGPVDPPPPEASSARSPASCLRLLRPLLDILPVEAEPTFFLSRLVEVLQGLFPSVGGARQALARASPRRLQENLFGGRFLKNAADFNLSGAVGARGSLGRELLSSNSLAIGLRRNRDLVQSVSRALEDPAFLATLQHTLTGSSSTSSLQQVRVNMSAGDQSSAHSKLLSVFHTELTCCLSHRCPSTSSDLNSTRVQ